MKTDMKRYMQERRLKRRNTLLAMSSNRCKVCSSTMALEFDHRVKSSKLFTLSGKNLDKKWDTILEEFSKCDLLCSDCHLLKTKENGDNVSSPPAKEFTHGTARMYSEKGCRCPECRYSKSLYREKLVSYGG